MFKSFCLLVISVAISGNTPIEEVNPTAQLLVKIINVSVLSEYECSLLVSAAEASS